MQALYRQRATRTTLKEPFDFVGIRYQRPDLWWHPWAGAEITVERIPGGD